MLIEPGDYLINSVSEKGQALSYTPPTDSIGVAVAGEQGSKVCSMSSSIISVVDDAL